MTWLCTWNRVKHACNTAHEQQSPTSNIHNLKHTQQLVLLLVDMLWCDTCLHEGGDIHVLGGGETREMLSDVVTRGGVTEGVQDREDVCRSET